MIATPSSAERNSRSTNNEWSTYRVYGLTLASDFAFTSRLAPGAGSPELTFTCVPEPPLSNSWDRNDPVYASPPYPDADGESEVLLYRSGRCLIVRFTDIADFYLWPNRIFCHRRPLEYRRRLSRHSHEVADRSLHMLVEIYLLGLVLACWLEWRGIPALHASAVIVGGRAVAFLSNGGGGKSSSAVTLMQAGYPLLTDDVLPLERTPGAYVGRPGYPQMRMWPEQAEHFLGHYKDFELVHPAVSKRRVPIEGKGFGDFCGTSQPLACLYLPERRNPADWGTRVEIKTVPRREAVMALLGHSFVPTMVEALGLQARRLDFFAQMVSEVPVRRITYPSGFDHLPRVRDAILDDLADLPSATEGA